MNRRPHAGYTLTEMLVALAVGMAVMQIAFASFFFIQKFVRRIDRVDGMNQVAQAAVLWSIGKPTKTTDYPRSNNLDEAQVSGIGVPSDGPAMRPMTPPVGATTFSGRCTYTVRDLRRKRDLETRSPPDLVTYDYDTFLVVPVQTP